VLVWDHPVGEGDNGRVALADQLNTLAEDGAKGVDGTLDEEFARVTNWLAELVASEAGALAADKHDRLNGPEELERRSRGIIAHDGSPCP